MSFFKIKKRQKYLNLEKKKFLFDKIVNTKINNNSIVFDKWTLSFAGHFVKHGKKKNIYKKVKNELLDFYSDFTSQKSVFWIIAFNESHKRADYIFRIFQQKFIYNKNWNKNKFFFNKKKYKKKIKNKTFNEKYNEYEYDKINEYKNHHVARYFNFNRFVNTFFSKKAFELMLSFFKNYSYRENDYYKNNSLEKIKNCFYSNKKKKKTFFVKFFKKIMYKNIKNKKIKNKKISAKFFFNKKFCEKKNFHTIKNIFTKKKFVKINKKNFIFVKKPIFSKKKFIKIKNKKYFFIKPKKYFLYFYKNNNNCTWIKKKDYFYFNSKLIHVKFNEFNRYSKFNKIKIFEKINEVFKFKINRFNYIYWYTFFSKFMNNKKHIKKIRFKKKKTISIDKRLNYIYKKFDYFYYWKKNNNNYKIKKNKFFKISSINKVKYRVKQIMVPEVGKFLIVERKYNNVSYKNFFIDFIKLITPSLKVFKQQRKKGTPYYTFYSRKTIDFYDHQKMTFNVLKDMINKNESYNHLIRNPKKPKKKIIPLEPKKSKRVNVSFSERFFSEFNKLINFEGEIYSKLDEYDSKAFIKKKYNKHFRWELFKIMRYFALTNKSLKRRTPRHHPPFVRKINNKNSLRKYLKIRRIYLKPGRNFEFKYTYRLPRYKRIQRFFQRNRVYMRRLYGQMRDNHIAALTKKINQKVDKKRRLSKNIGQYLEFQASAFLLINRFYPKVNELRQLVQNNHIVVNGRSFKGFYKKMHSYDFCKINFFNRPNDEPFINLKLRKSIWKKIRKIRVVSCGYTNATIQINAIKDSTITSNFFFDYNKSFNNSEEINFYNNVNIIFHNWAILHHSCSPIEKNFDFKRFVNKVDFSPFKKIDWMMEKK